MKVNLNGHEVEYVEGYQYLDFYVDGGKPIIIEVGLGRMLEQLAADKMDLDQQLIDRLRLLTRWVHEAPRKRFFRNRIKNGNFLAAIY